MTSRARSGFEVLRSPSDTKGTAFTLDERKALRLEGLRPHAVLMSEPARFAPIVYDPTIVDACLTYGHIYR